MIEADRLKFLNSAPVRKGRYVLYWMQASQRPQANHALEYAAQEANLLNLPLVVYFGITDRFPEANARHYAFMLEGLAETRKALEKRDIRFFIQQESPEKGVVRFAEQAALAVADCGYLKVQKKWRRDAAAKIACRFIQVETDVTVPVETVSNKREYAAATLRPKMMRLMDAYLKPVERMKLKHSALGLRFGVPEFSVDPADKALAKLDLDCSVGPVPDLKGGSSQAQKLLRVFIEESLKDYALERNDPNREVLSKMSPYLHFGQISPLEIALAVKASGQPGKTAYLEELIVRRELSMNFTHFTPDYDDYECLPAWCKKTLAAHRKDKREYGYTQEQFERALTHDVYWNAAQTEMVRTGKMHGYMRMYWGKKILEWSKTPEEAYRTALWLNNKYELDGRDPNGFAGVAWCFGNHDRPWGERPVFGMVRYMNAQGLKRKFDADAYVRKAMGKGQKSLELGL